MDRRAEVERRIAGRTLWDLLREVANRHGHQPAAWWRDDGRWRSPTWWQQRRLMGATAGLASLGVERGDFVALMMDNRVQHVLTDQVAVHAGGAPTTLYSTHSASRAGPLVRQPLRHQGSAAPLGVDLAESLAALGLPVLEVSGLTETTGVTTGNPPDALRIGTVSPPIARVELRLADHGEMLLRGRTPLRATLNDPTATPQLLDADGWLHTGDVGALMRPATCASSIARRS